MIFVMKKICLLVVMLTISLSLLFSQGCLPEGINFHSQSQIDDFQSNYPGCTEILGDVFIGSYYGSDISNLNGLNVLTSIGGYLTILDTQLSNLSGLELLNSIESFEISHNFTLINLIGLESLKSVGGSFVVNNNPNLQTLSGLDSLSTISWSLAISDVGLTSLAGLDNLITVGDNFSLSFNTDLISLSGLENLTTIGGDLSVHSNSSLVNIMAISTLTFIGGDIIISSNPALTSLEGLNNLDQSSISNLSIYYNDILSSCNAQSICNYLSEPNGTINIYGNSTGCNNAPEIASLCNIDFSCLPFGNYYFINQTEVDSFLINYPECNDLEGGVIISGDDINSLNGLTSINSIGGSLQIGAPFFGGNPLLTNLSGLENLTSIGGQFFIQYNDALINLSGLEGLASIGNKLFIRNNDALINLTGLNNLASVGYKIQIYDNFSLTSLIGLESLINVASGINIDNNDALISLTGIDNIDVTSMTGLMISYNSSLSDCDVQSICEYIANPGGSIAIYSNSTGCNSLTEVQQACLTSVEENNYEKKIILFPNPATESITITINGDLPIDEATIYNHFGQLVQVSKPINNVVNVSSLTAGIYYVQINTKDMRLMKTLMIK